MTVPKQSNGVQGTDLSGILNIIRANATDAYQSAIPFATASNITEVGSAIATSLPQIKNEFMTNLYNKIGLTLIDQPEFRNDLAFLKKGVLPMGQTIEDIYVGWAQAHEFITGMKEGVTPPDPFSIKKLEHYTYFYSVVYSRQYQITRHMTDLNKAFNNESSLGQFTSALMSGISNPAEYDEYRMTIALLARQIEEANKAGSKAKSAVHLITEFKALYPESTITADTCMQDRDFLNFVSVTMKKWSKRLTKPRKDLNFANVLNVTPASEQTLIMLQDAIPDFENNLLAWAYNENYLQLKDVVEIEAWYSIGNTPTASTVTPDKLGIKATVADGVQCLACLFDTNMVKYYNRYNEADSMYNPKGRYWNFFYTVEDVLACSPYKNFVAFMLD